MHGGRFDWLAEFGGATALAAAGGYAALKLSPSFELAPATAMLGSGFGCLAIGLLAMKAVGAGPRHHRLPELEIPAIGIHAEEPLLLENLYEEPLLLEDALEDDPALLLDDALPAAEPESRVVQLFAHPAIPTAGQLKDRIDRHLAGATWNAESQMPAPAAPDAAEALYAALNKLKRSLR
jgi:hypothetical protein